MKGADGDHNAVGAVIIEMVVYGWTFDAAQIAGQHRGIVGIPIGQGFGHQSPEIQPADNTQHEHQQYPGNLGKCIQRRIDTAGGMFTFAGFLYIAHDAFGPGIYGLLLLGHQIQ